MNWLDPHWIVNHAQVYVLLFVTLVIFLESAFVPTSFLPGDSLLFLFGLTLSGFASTGDLVIDAASIASVVTVAFLGSLVAFLIGEKFGEPLVRRSRLAQKAGFREKAHSLFESYGDRAILLSRFTPVIRSLVPLLAGIAGMSRKNFLKYDALGALAWVGGLSLTGYLLGSNGWVQSHLDTVMLTIIVVTSLPFPVEVLLRYLEAKRNRV